MKRKITLFIAAAALSGAALVAAAFGDTSSASPLHASNGARMPRKAAKSRRSSITAC